MFLLNQIVGVLPYYIADVGHYTAEIYWKNEGIIDIEELIRLKELLKTIQPTEIWLYKNKEAFESVQSGLKESSEGKISKLNLDEI